MREARELLAVAETLVDAEHDGAHDGVLGMARALARARGSEVTNAAIELHARTIAAWVVLKYAACVLAACVPVAIALATGVTALLLLAPLAFYVVEANLVFVVPALLDGSRRPFASSRALVERSGGTLAALARVVPIAIAMIAGGLAGRGFARSWRVGCAAVVVWYERARASSTTELA